MACREGDYETEGIWPEMEALGKFHGLMGACMRASGGTPTAGRQLLAWALRCGVERGRVEVGFSTTSYCTESGRRTVCEFLLFRFALKLG